MSSNDDRQSGIPTRAIHEAYLDMHRALKRYRQSKDAGEQIGGAHGDVQETVLTLYELLRPHIKQDEGVNDYWQGKPPSYDGNTQPDPEDGKGLLEIQKRKQPVQISPDKADAFDDADSLEDYHELIGLNGTVRLTGVHVDGNVAFVAYDAYQLGLRELDSWETKYTTTTSEYGGFLGSTAETKPERKRVKISKLKRAARELSDVAKELGFLPQSEIPDNEDPIPI